MGLRRFLGLIGFYHALMPNLAAIEVPLTDLMQGAKKKDGALLIGRRNAFKLLSSEKRAWLMSRT